jgi:hypothetical protein
LADFDDLGQRVGDLGAAFVPLRRRVADLAADLGDSLGRVAEVWRESASTSLTPGLGIGPGVSF